MFQILTSARQDTNLQVPSAFAWSLVDVRKYPQQEHELPDHDNQALGALITVWHTSVNRWTANNFSSNKYTVQAHRPILPFTISGICRLVIYEYQRDFPAFSMLANTTSVLAVSSILQKCEFSFQNRVKTKWSCLTHNVDHRVVTCRSFRIFVAVACLLHAQCHVWLYTFYQDAALAVCKFIKLFATPVDR